MEQVFQQMKQDSYKWQWTRKSYQKESKLKKPVIMDSDIL